MNIKKSFSNHVFIIRLKGNGYSLVETMVITFIIVLVLALLSTIYVNYSKTYSYQQAQTEIADSSRAVMAELQNEILEASGIAESHDFSDDTYATDQSTLVLKIPSIDASDDVIDATFDYVVFYQTGSTLMKETDPDPASSRASGPRQLSDTVASLTFAYDNVDVAEADKVDVDLESETVTKGKTVSYQLSQTIYLRNK